MTLALLGTPADRYNSALAPHRSRLHTWRLGAGADGWYLDGCDRHDRSSLSLLVAVCEAAPEGTVHIVDKPHRHDEVEDGLLASIPLLVERGVRIFGVHPRARLSTSLQDRLAAVARQHGALLCLARRREPMPAGAVSVSRSPLAAVGDVAFIEPEEYPQDPSAGDFTSCALEPLATVLGRLVELVDTHPDEGPESWYRRLKESGSPLQDLPLRTVLNRLPVPERIQEVVRVITRLVVHASVDPSSPSAVALRKKCLMLRTSGLTDSRVDTLTTALHKAGQDFLGDRVTQGAYGLDQSFGHSHRQGFADLCAHARLRLPVGEDALQRLETETTRPESKRRKVVVAHVRDTLIRLHRCAGKPDEDYLQRLEDSTGDTLPPGPAGPARDALALELSVWSWLLHDALGRKDLSRLVKAFRADMHVLFGDLEAPHRPALPAPVQPQLDRTIYACQVTSLRALFKASHDAWKDRAEQVELLLGPSVPGGWVAFAFVVQTEDGERLAHEPDDGLAEFLGQRLGMLRALSGHAASPRATPLFKTHGRPSTSGEPVGPDGLFLLSANYQLDLGALHAFGGFGTAVLPQGDRFPLDGVRQEVERADLPAGSYSVGDLVASRMGPPAPLGAEGKARLEDLLFLSTELGVRLHPQDAALQDLRVRYYRAR